MNQLPEELSEPIGKSILNALLLFAEVSIRFMPWGELLKTVSVIVPAYNEELTLERTITSLLKQTLPADEIIVVDDYSSDGTGKIAESMGVRVLRPPKNQGSKGEHRTTRFPTLKPT